MKALILVDLVNAYKESITPKLILNTLKLTEHFKKKKWKVINAVPKGEKNPVMIRLWGDEFKGNNNLPKGKRLSDLVPELQKIKFDKIVKKPEYSAFFRTDLEEYCSKNKINELYFAGVYSGVCVHYSAIDAAMRKIWPVLVEDATNTISKKQHNKNIKRFREVAGSTMKTKEIIK